jgi:uncharacterized peroxidase-related enzyme
VSAHAEFLRAASKDEDLATRLKSDYRTASLPEQDRRMLEFVEKLTLYPWLLTRTDIDRLRSAGFPDTAVLHIVLGSAHFNYLNRMADGIGIRFEYDTEIPEASIQSSKPGYVEVTLQDAALTRADATCVAWIATSEPEPDGSLSGSEEPGNLYRVMTGNPEARDLAREWRDYQLRGTTQLDASCRSQLALYISGLNHCEYSAYWIRKRLVDLGERHSLCDRLAGGELPQEAAIRERLFFAHAERLTREAASTREEHIHQLRQAGLDDSGILQLTMLCSYFSFENRVALSLGVPIERERL